MSNKFHQHLQLMRSCQTDAFILWDMMESFVVDVGYDGPLTLKQIYCGKSFAIIMLLYRCLVSLTSSRDTIHNYYMYVVCSHPW